MYLEAVTVCVDYSDFLAHTLPLNRQHFDHWIIVTSKGDFETQRLCKHYNVECLTTDKFYEEGSTFNKAKGINQALEYFSKRDWMIHIDADIVLPPNFRTMVEKMELEKDKIYGVDRLMCPNYDEWTKYIRKPKPIYQDWIFVHLNVFPIASRVADYNGEGYSPIGFFQMWHPRTSNVNIYPENHDGADRTDMAFAKKWKRQKRQLMAEIVTIHLDSENATIESMGKNWQGRKTVPFGYEPIKKKKKKIFWNKVLYFTAIMCLGIIIGYLISLFFPYLLKLF